MKKILITILFTLSANMAIANSFVDEVTELVGANPEVNINLSTGLLKTILAFSDDEEAKVARVAMSGLNKIQVSVYDLNKNSKSKKLSQLIKSKIKQLTAQGYEQIVTVNGRSETVNIIAKVEGEYLSDAMIVVMEDDELVIISLDGDVDLKHLTEITGNFDLDIDDLVDI